MPIFSQSALKKCLESFNITYAAWGIEVAWVHLLNNEKIAVIDLINATHTRPLRSENKIMPNGLTPQQEVNLIFNYYNIRHPNCFY